MKLANVYTSQNIPLYSTLPPISAFVRVSSRDMSGMQSTYKANSLTIIFYL